MNIFLMLFTYVKLREWRILNLNLNLKFDEINDVSEMPGGQRWMKLQIKSDHEPP